MRAPQRRDLDAVNPTAPGGWADLPSGPSRDGPVATSWARGAQGSVPGVGAHRAWPRPRHHRARGLDTLQGMTENEPAAVEHLAQDTRVITLEAEKYNATLVKRIDERPDLARVWVRADGEAAHFEPGQYMTIGVYADEKLYQRPYSVASAPTDTGEEGYEFYVRLVPILRFTTLLWRLPVGHQMRMIGPKGRFMLEPDDERTHLFVSTGTGIAPFIAMSRHLLAQGTPRRTIMLHGCSYQDELGYRESARGLGARRQLSDDLRAHHLAAGRSPQRGLDRLHGTCRGRRP